MGFFKKVSSFLEDENLEEETEEIDIIAKIISLNEKQLLRLLLVILTLEHNSRLLNSTSWEEIFEKIKGE